MNSSSLTSLVPAPDTSSPDVGASLQQHAAWRPALALGAGSLLLAGLLYAAVGTGLARLAFPQQSNGSLLLDAQGQVRGSRLIAQPFSADGYFQTRPSAAGYDPMAAAGSNLARSNPALAERVAAAAREVGAREGIAPADVPADLITQSGAGLDPELSPAAAKLQVARVARARGWSPEQVQALLQAHAQGPQWGLLGQPRVNVMDLNRALDAAADAR